MPAQLYGIEHFTYIGITTVIASVGLILAKKFAKTEKSQAIFFKMLGACIIYFYSHKSLVASV
jgi:hypothetical protein